MDLIVDFPRHPRRMPKRVTFANDIEIFVENLALCSDLRANIWSSKDEMKSYKYQFAISVKEMRKFMAAVAKGEMLENVDTDNFVGLENFTTDSSHIEVQDRRSATRKAVLNEQKRQDKIGVCNIDSLARVSAAESKWARERAQFFGKLHAER